MERIKNYILNSSYFKLDKEEDGLLAFSTREHGIHGEEYDDAGEADIEEAIRLIDLIHKNFKDVIASFSYCDEWTLLTVEENV